MNVVLNNNQIWPNACWLGSGLCNRKVPFHWEFSVISNFVEWKAPSFHSGYNPRPPPPPPPSSDKGLLFIRSLKLSLNPGLISGSLRHVGTFGHLIQTRRAKCSGQCYGQVAKPHSIREGRDWNGYSKIRYPLGDWNWIKLFFGKSLRLFTTLLCWNASIQRLKKAKMRMVTPNMDQSLHRG